MSVRLNLCFRTLTPLTLACPSSGYSHYLFIRPKWLLYQNIRPLTRSRCRFPLHTLHLPFPKNLSRGRWSLGDMGITEIEHTSAQNREHVTLKLVPGFIFLARPLTFLAFIYLAKFQNRFASDNISLSFISQSYAMIHNILSSRCGIPSSWYGIPLSTKLVWIFWKCDIESWVCRKCYITFELMHLNV